MTQRFDPAPIRNVLVVGAGTMGNGIAQVVAEAGIETILSDADPGQLASGLRAIETRWERLITSGKKSSEQTVSARGALQAGTVSDAARVGLVIEAIVEDVDAKAALFSHLAGVAAPDTLFASNTSSLSITYLGRASGRPDRLAGLHFFNPVPVLPLVEVVRGLETSDSTLAALTAFAAAIGKQPVTVSDAPGFVANRLLLPMVNEAIFALEEGVADAQSIDRVMKLGAAHPMGPLALADLIGLDVCLAILETLHRDFGDDKYRPATLLRRMVAAGRLGRKSGAGFFTY
jgi:3-hydroxybutyryl-CoA dehydrogenase